MEVHIDKKRTTDLLQQLVQIESVNPSLAPGAKGEGEIAHFVVTILEEAGVEAKVEEVAPHRPNVIGRLPGSGGGKTLIFNAHLDTVTVEGMEDPFSGHITDGKLFGRGAWDTKGGLAAGLAALLAIHEAPVPLAGDLILVGAIDEEHASLGTQALLQEVQADGCIILEPSDLALWVAHGGFAWVEVETRGVTAHGSLPDEGVDAISKMGRVLVALEELGKRIHRHKDFHPPLGGDTMNPSLHASLIEGGREWSSYPDRCLLRLERRMIPTETPEEVESELENLLHRLAAEDPQFKAEWRMTMARRPWQAEEGLLLESLEAACTDELGAPTERATGLIWTDAALMQEAGIPTVILGPKGEGKHALVEYVEIDSVVVCARILTRTAIEFCNQAQ